MEISLTDFYSSSDVQSINSAFSTRTDLQYYANRPVDAEVIEKNRKECKEFYIKTKDILSKITEKQIEQIKKQFKDIS